MQLHTLEDFPAHSNFCELALIKMGYHDVFVHVGDQVKVQGRDGQWVAPLVTGTFTLPASVLCAHVKLQVPLGQVTSSTVC